MLVELSTVASSSVINAVPSLLLITYAIYAPQFPYGNTDSDTYVQAPANN